ncbi:MAG: 30S ribosomal protein S10 [Halobacteriota archaeon]
MTTVTKLTFQSGDRIVLDEFADDLKHTLEHKGVECKGPHSPPAETVRVPQYRRLTLGDEFSPWTYNVFTRHMAIHGSEHIAREVAHMDFPQSVHVEIEVEQRRPAGHRQR